MLQVDRLNEHSSVTGIKLGYKIMHNVWRKKKVESRQILTSQTYVSVNSEAKSQQILDKTFLLFIFFYSIA